MSIFIITSTREYVSTIFFSQHVNIAFVLALKKEKKMYAALLGLQGTLSGRRSKLTPEMLAVSGDSTPLQTGVRMDLSELERSTMITSNCPKLTNIPLFNLFLIIPGVYTILNNQYV